MTYSAGPPMLGPDPALGAAAAFEPVAVVAQPPKDDDTGGKGADFGKSSPVGLLVLLLFFIAVAFLVRSMTKHLKRLPASFDPPVEEKEDGDEPAEEAPSSDDDEKPNAPSANGKSDPA